MQLRLYVVFFIVFSSQVLMAQNYMVDSLVTVNVQEVIIIQDYKFNNSREEKKYKVLEEDINIIYPLLLIVRNDYARINKELELYDGDREKQFLKWYEKYAKEHYMHHLAKLNIRQGRLFLKLISRELNSTPYNIIKQYRNGFDAALWQLAANFYLANLKTSYSPEDNPMVEHILKRIENMHS